jgi:hypothetical protein
MSRVLNEISRKAAILLPFRRSRSTHDANFPKDYATTAVFCTQLSTGLELTFLTASSYILKSEEQIEAMSPVSRGGKFGVPVLSITPWRCMGEWRYSSTILDLSTRCEWVCKGVFIFLIPSRSAVGSTQYPNQWVPTGDKAAGAWS